jgi:hypothetical protein
MNPAIAQDDDESPADPAVNEASVDVDDQDAAETAEAAQAADEDAIDDEFYQDVDDEDFRPSEDIPADQSISFPADI